MRHALVAGALALAWSNVLAQVTDSGSGAVAVSPRLVATVPGTAELRLDTSDITFDLGDESLQAADLACVYGRSGGDVVDETVPELDHQVAVLPLGTGFRAGPHPVITIDGAGAVSGYPPLRLDEGGEALARSDRDFVCYRTFLLHRFSNATDWHLTVERPPAGEPGVLGAVYLRDSGCDGSTGLRGLFPLYAGQRQLLASAATSSPCPDGDVVVLAVKPGGAQAGEFRAHLVYTLMAPTFDPTTEESPR